MTDKELTDAFQALLQRIALENGFSNISVHVSASSERSVTVYGHYGEKQCVQTFGRTIDQAITKALDERAALCRPFQEAA